MRLGFGEILVILALALLFFGPSKLPKLGQSLGEAIRGLKKGLQGMDEEVKADPTALPQAKETPAAPAPTSSASKPS